MNANGTRNIWFNALRHELFFSNVEDFMSFNWAAGSSLTELQIKRMLGGSGFRQLRLSHRGIRTLGFGLDARKIYRFSQQWMKVLRFLSSFDDLQNLYLPVDEAGSPLPQPSMFLARANKLRTLL
jgi:hypothetical protein